MSDLIYLLPLENLIPDWTQRTASVSWQSVPGVFLRPPSFSWPKAQHTLQTLPYFLRTLLLQSSTLTFAPQDMWSRRTPDLGCFGPGFLTFFLETLSHNMLAAVSFLRDWQVCRFCWLFWAQATRHSSIRESRNILLPFFTTTKLRTLRLASTTQARTELRFLSPASSLCNRNAPSSKARGQAVGEGPCSRGSLVCGPHHGSGPRNPPLLHSEHQQQLLWPHASHKTDKVCVHRRLQRLSGSRAGAEMCSFIPTHRSPLRHHKQVVFGFMLQALRDRAVSLRFSAVSPALPAAPVHHQVPGTELSKQGTPQEREGERLPAAQCRGSEQNNSPLCHQTGGPRGVIREPDACKELRSGPGP